MQVLQDVISIDLRILSRVLYLLVLGGLLLALFITLIRLGLKVFFVSLTISTIFFLTTSTGADARHRRRHHARPEIHRSVHSSISDTGTYGKCNVQTWVEGTVVPYPYATGTSVTDLSGRNTKW